ncbi:helix-turn-helix domain-containing protein [uncultured Pseudosulfitobacter sp.]|uniref:winged helix-turn-helix transcriptional regulator n=1 Tax=uncultured Pseudosulfitobacter sp. TaxID=2854214 RepID=UPI0030DC600F
MKDTTQDRKPWLDPVTGTCPVGETLRLLGGKHGPSVLHCLMAGEMHFLELTRALDGISRKVLTAQLQEFERSGLVARIEKHDARRRVGYSLTGKGADLGAILSQLYDWSQDHLAGITQTKT